MVVISPGRELQRDEQRAPTMPEVVTNGSRTEALRRWALILPLTASALFSLIFIYRSAFVVGGEHFFSLFNDAMVSMRYARNLADGYGLVWNPGESPVEGYTNFLWTVWMAGLHLLPVPSSKVSLLTRWATFGVAVW